MHPGPLLCLARMTLQHFYSPACPTPLRSLSNWCALQRSGRGVGSVRLVLFYRHFQSHRWLRLPRLGYKTMTIPGKGGGQSLPATPRPCPSAARPCLKHSSLHQRSRSGHGGKYWGAEIHQVFVFLKLKFPGLGNDVKAVIGPLNISSGVVGSSGHTGTHLDLPPYALVLHALRSTAHNTLQILLGCGRN